MGGLDQRSPVRGLLAHDLLTQRVPAAGLLGKGVLAGGVTAGPFAAAPVRGLIHPQA